MGSSQFHRLTCLGLLLLSPAGCGGPSTALIDTGVSAGAGPQQLTPDGQELLRRFLQAANLPDLEWPSFSNYEKEVAEFYDAFGGRLPWIAGAQPTPQARAMIQSLKNAAYKGLRPEDYDGPRWDARLAQLAQSPEGLEADLVRFDLALTVATMRYVSDLHVGRVNPRLFHFDLEIDHTKFDLSEFLKKELVRSQNVDSALESAEPPFPVYHRTEAALKTYLELLARDDGQLLPLPSHTVKPGSSYEGVPRLAKLLSLLGDLRGDLGQMDEVYQGTLVDGVKHFQKRHGLEPSGWIDRATVKELNTPLSHRVLQLELTMERIRWLPHEFARPPIVVNIPEFRLHADDERYHWVFSMKVVVGKAYRHQTPVFASEIKAVIFRPYWDVPSSILKQELLPHLEKDPSYLADNSYEVVDKNGTVVSSAPISREIKDQLRAGALRVRQVPGPKNALGLVKFDIPSRYDIYMHGTPATELFSRSRRDFSHGCIRVEDPVKLAEWVLRGMPGWDRESIEAAMAGEETVRAKLDKPIPVLILYNTAVVMEDEEVYFFDDIYGHDAALERVLNQGFPYAAGAEIPAGQ